MHEPSKYSARLFTIPSVDDPFVDKANVNFITNAVPNTHTHIHQMIHLLELVNFEIFCFYHIHSNGNFFI